ncbi:MAG: GAF domain-containing protein [Acidimicrobiales bacterium]
MDQGPGPELWWQRDPGSPPDRPRQPWRALLAAESAVVVAWMVASAVVVRVLTSGHNRTLSGAAASVLFVVTTGVMVVAILVFARLSSRRIRQGLRDADVALRSMELVTDPALSFLALDELLDELLARTRDVAGGDVATVLLLTPDGRFLSVRASRGLEQWMIVGALVPVGEGILGSVASRAEAVIVHDVGRVAEAMPLLRDRVSSLLAAPLLVAGRVIGVVQVGTRHPHRFHQRDLRLLQLVADRAAASIERARLDESERRSRLGAEQARRHLDLLARAGDVLATALESYDEAFVRLVEVVVPSFADWFAVDLVDEGGNVRRVAHGARGERARGVGEAEGIAASRHRHPDGDRLIHQALTSGRPELVMNARRMGQQHQGALAGPGEFTDAAPAAGVESMIVVPIHVRGLAFGTLSLVTGTGRRGYRRSDLDTALGLAERVAIAVERVLLWRETSQAEETATRNAAQLRRLVEAALGVNAALEEPEVLRVLAEHARQVFDADWAVVSGAGMPGQPVGSDLPAAQRDLVGSAARRVVAGQRPVRTSAPEEPAWLGAPVGKDRALLVFRAAPFSAESEPMAVLLAQMAAEALENARLYQAVQGNEERLRAVVDSSPLAIAEMDMDGAAQWWNAAAAELFGWPPAGAPGGLRVPARPAAAQQLEDLWRRTRRGEATVGVEISGFRPDGRSISLSVSTAPLRDAAGVVRGILAVMEDVTERRRMLEQFHQTERLGAMARLAGGVAHDFNNLLTVILGSSEILLRRVEDDTVREEVEAIKRAGERAAALTNQLLAIGQRPPVQPVVTDPDTVVAAMQPMLSRVLGPGVHIEVVPAALPQRILVDPAELERALLNMAINAKDAMAGGGTFTIATAPRASGGDHHEVAITVSDDGGGMDGETAAHCFEPFFTTKGRAHGTGLGLAAVHAMVSQAGGRISVESEPGQGTSFLLVFPAATGEPADDAAPGDGAEAGGKETVLVVEDEDELRRLEVQALEWRGYTVLAAAGGAEALSMADEIGRVPDLLVTDVVMPGMGGVELAEELRARWHGLPVLFVSGHLAEQSLAEEADFLAKPFTPEQLGRRVRQALDHQRDEASTA